MKKYKIAVLGGGIIGSSLARGLIKSGQYTAEEIILTEKRRSRISFLQKNGFKVTENNSEAIDHARIIIMAVKPQQFKALADEI
ncbi:MAG: NAD(P)-binding domain-containing protein, partial [Bacteroidales bacterium]|nr:NAD(P)-binding domain-containing protein [Bacteroidales bacterium]